MKDYEIELKPIIDDYRRVYEFSKKQGEIHKSDKIYTEQNNAAMKEIRECFVSNWSNAQLRMKRVDNV